MSLAWVSNQSSTRQPVALQAMAADVSGSAPKAQIFQWKGCATTFDVPYDVYGTGDRTFVLCPAISSVSCRQEMESLAKQLSSSGRCILTDWPGFGNTNRQGKRYTAEMCSEFAADLLLSSQVATNKTIDVITAGHGSGMIVHALASLTAAGGKIPPMNKLILVAPTFQGPFRVVGLSSLFRQGFRTAFETPLLGEYLHKGLTTPANVLANYKSHVFSTDKLLTEEYVQNRADLSRKPLARYGVAAFVTGGLDLYPEPEAFGQALASLELPIQVVLGTEFPKKSLAAIQAALTIAKEGGPSVDVVEVPGSLGLHEEYPDEVYKVVAPFLGVA